MAPIDNSGFLRRLILAVRGPSTLSILAEPPIMTECRILSTITVAARGDAFDFQVRPTFTWTGKGMSEQAFEQWIETCTPDAVQALRLRLQPIARKFEPHYAHALEKEVNATLATVDWKLGPTAVTLTCQPEVFVLPDRRVRESMQPFWQRRVEMQSEHDLAMRHAQLIRERTQAWSTIMAALQNDPLATHAALLVEHKEFAEVFQKMTQGRKDELLKLIDLLEAAGRSFNDIGLYEYAEGLDAALTAYRKQAGLG